MTERDFTYYEIENSARVDADDATDHLGNDNHVTKVGLDEVGLLVGLSLLLGLAKLLDKTHGAALQATVDPAAGTSVDNIAELVGGEVEEPIGRKVKSVWGCSLRQHSSQFHLPSSRRILRGVDGGSNVLVKVDSSVGELSERSLSLELGSLLGVLLNQEHRSQKVLAIISNYLTAANRVSEQLPSLSFYIFFFEDGF
ncbi:hypothetical protein HG530_004702 [Fusarium avenaceum]|nr:hypothetical protein HG530_004702 [Fusarium avenaceum]